MFKDIIFPIKFRKYQKEILDNFEEFRKTACRRYHYVAPPGSGKTIAGLEIVRRLNQKAVVLSPNSTIQTQWIDKLKQLTDKISVSSDPFSNADVLSLTYQSISVKQRGTDELHDNAIKTIEKLKDYPTIILDECHHLLSHWASVISQMINNDTTIVGLTATPPIHRSDSEIKTYLDLVGPISYQIPMPAVIKEGNLAPFQDLVFIIEPSDDEMDIIQAMSKSFNDVFSHLKSLDPPLIPIQIWAYNRLGEYLDKKGRIIPFDEFLMSNPDYCIALSRFVKKEFGDLPPNVIMIDEMEDDPIIQDVILVLEDYSLNYLISTNQGKELYEQLKPALKEIGYSLSSRGIRSLNTGLSTILGLSSSKMAAMKKIIAHEMLYMGEDIRIIILTDYELGKHTDGLSAINAMDVITSDSEVDPIDPILLTGSTVLVDDDLLPVFMDFAQRYFQQVSLDITLSTNQIEGYYEISGTGSDWNTKTYVLMITKMLEAGLTKCLIGTRSLLGEGWDSIKVNTLIDLTLTSTFVSVNQIMGRTIRKDIDNPYKVANNWDIVTIAEETQRGFYDYERFKRKHANFYGLSDDNVIEKGIGHVNPLLTNIPLGKILFYKDEINHSSMERSIGRLNTYKNWKIGEPYEGYESISIDFVPRDKKQSYQIPVKNIKAAEDYIISVKKKKKSMYGFSGTFLAACIVIAALVSSQLLEIIFLGSGVALFFISNLFFKYVYLDNYHKRSLIHLNKNSSIKENLFELGKTVLYSLKEIGELEDHIAEDDIEILQRTDGAYRILLHNTKNGTLFSKCVAEILSPIQNQKYIITRTAITFEGRLKDFLNKANQKSVVNYHPLPQKFCINRSFADVFQKYWNQFISPGELVYTRQKEGKQIIKQFFRKKQVDIHHVKKDIWM